MVEAMASLGEAASPYLPPAAARGCAYCFDPASSLLRAALMPHPRLDRHPTGPFLADLAFLHQLLRKQYSGLVCQVPTRRFFFDAPVEGVGVPVDVYLERSDQDVTELLPFLDQLWAVGGRASLPPAF